MLSSRTIRLILFLALFVLCSSTSVHFSCVSISNLFWRGREGGLLYPLDKDVRLDRYTIIPNGSLILYGGSYVDINGNILGMSDMDWSQDNGLTWNKIYPDNIFLIPPLGIYCRNPIINELYFIEYSTVAKMWSSKNFTYWQSYVPMTNGSSAFVENYNPACIVDDLGIIYYFSGADNTKNPYKPYGNLWISSNQGRFWTETRNPMFDPRYNQLVAFCLMTKTIYVMGGIGSNGSHFNDLWSTTDSGQTWTQILDRYPWSQQNIIDATFAVSPNGILTVNSRIVIGNTDQSELWISIDQGVTWNQCTANAEYGYRRNAMITWDKNGTMYLASGYQGGDYPYYANDIWVSNINFTDAHKLVDSCGGSPLTLMTE